MHGRAVPEPQSSAAVVSAVSSANSQSSDSDSLSSGTKRNVTLTFASTKYTGTYTGEFNADGLFDGYGEFEGEYSNSSGNDWSLTYKGEFKNGVFSGEGEQEWLNHVTGKKFTYKGSFERGTYDGEGYYEIFYPEVVASNERYDVKFTYDGTYTNGYNKKGKKTWYYSVGSYKVEEGEFTTDSNRNLTGVAYDYDSSGKLIAKRVYEDGKVVSQIGS